MNYILNLYFFPESRTVSESKIQQLFEKYKDETEDAVLSEGVEQLCIDLQLKPDEFKVLGKKLKTIKKQIVSDQLKIMFVF